MNPESSINRALNNLVGANLASINGVIVSATDPAAQYSDIKSAVDSGAERIFVKSGTYTLAQSMTLSNQTLIGEDRDSTIINLDGAVQIKIGTNSNAETAGTVTMSGGTQTVIGAGTSFLNLEGKENLFLSIDSALVQIFSIDSDTQLSLLNAWPGKLQSGASYAIMSAKSLNSMISNFTVKAFPAGADATPMFAIEDLFTTIQNVRLSANHNKTVGIQIGDGTATKRVYGTRIIDCDFEGAGSGISIGSNAIASIIDSCNFNSQLFRAIIVSGDYHNITDCYIGNADDGIFINGADYIIVSGCTIENQATYGLQLSACTHSIFSKNLFQNQGHSGIKTDTSTFNLVIADNIFKSQTSFGIWLQSAQCTVTNNVFNDPGSTGIHMVFAVRSIIQGNHFFSCGGHGVALDSLSSNCIISGNSFQSGAIDGISCSGDKCVLNANQSNSNADDGIDVEATSDRIIITNNLLLSNSGSNLENTGTNTVAANNITV